MSVTDLAVATIVVAVTVAGLYIASNTTAATPAAAAATSIGAGVFKTQSANTAAAKPRVAAPLSLILDTDPSLNAFAAGAVRKAVAARHAPTIVLSASAIFVAGFASSAFITRAITRTTLFRTAFV